jgi:hypothetical protein
MHILPLPPDLISRSAGQSVRVEARLHSATDVTLVGGMSTAPRLVLSAGICCSSARRAPTPEGAASAHSAYAQSSAVAEDG